MGFFFSKAWTNLFEKKQVRILMVGLDAAGKTTIMYKLKMNETVKTIPTIGFNVETMEYKKLKMVMWDVGGQNKIMELWKHYYEGTDALIYVIDSSDTERLELNYETIHNIVQDPDLEKACLLIYANKQDLKQALSPSELVEKLQLQKLKMKWNIQGASAVSGQGLTEGLDWVAETLLKGKK
jgi:small GTP-binding protein